MTLPLKTDEQILLKEGSLGWNKYLTLTNKRILVTRNNRIESEKPLDQVVEAYPYTQGFTSLTQLKIRYREGKEDTFKFSSDSFLSMVGGVNYVQQNARSMTDRYINLINQMLAQSKKE